MLGKYRQSHRRHYPSELQFGAALAACRTLADKLTTLKGELIKRLQRAFGEKTWTILLWFETSPGEAVANATLPVDLRLKETNFIIISSILFRYIMTLYNGDLCARKNVMSCRPFHGRRIRLRD